MAGQDALLFFDKNPSALPLYEAFERKVLSEIDSVQIKVQKTQISFYNKRMFSCVSFAQVKKKQERPPCYIVVTFGLGHRVEAPRIQVATEPYPNRWIHHVMVSSVEEIDQELMGWVKEASVFSAGKR